jgi:hypothetical protein
MNLDHPFNLIPAGRLRWVFVPVLFVTLAAGTAILWALPGRQSQTLFDLALAGSVPRAQEILSHWTEGDRIHIAFVNGLDYLFGFVLFNTIALACVWTARVSSARAWATCGFALAWLSWVSVVLDIPENFAYLRMVFGTVDDPWPQVLKVCAVFRSFVFTIGVAYIGLGSVAWVLSVVRGEPPTRVPSNKPLQPTRAAQPNRKREPAGSGPRG